MPPFQYQHLDALGPYATAKSESRGRYLRTLQEALGQRQEAKNRRSLEMIKSALDAENEFNKQNSPYSQALTGWRNAQAAKASYDISNPQPRNIDPNSDAGFRLG